MAKKTRGKTFEIDDVAAYEALKIIARGQNRTLKYIMENAFNDYIKKNGKRYLTNTVDTVS